MSVYNHSQPPYPGNQGGGGMGQAPYPGQQQVPYQGQQQAPYPGQQSTVPYPGGQQQPYPNQQGPPVNQQQSQYQGNQQQSYRPNVMNTGPPLSKIELKISCRQVINTIMLS